MKKSSIFILLALLAFGPTAWAQTTWTEVGTKEALNSAIANGANIRLTADITLSAYLKIGETTTQVVTIDLNGHTLSRSLSAQDSNGHVIEVFGKGNLTLTSSQAGGTLTGGWANNGGGICNYGTVTLSNVTITGCKAKQGGGIKNNSGCTLTINTGVSIINNTCTIEGGGIWSDGTLNIQGMVVVNGNRHNSGMEQNLFLKSGKVITVTGSFAEGTNIGVLLENANGTFTSGYSTYNSSFAPNTYFTSDISFIQNITLNNNEATLSTPDGTAYYINREWDEVNKVVTVTPITITNYTVLSGSGEIQLQPGQWYVVSNNFVCDNIVAPSGEAANLIVCDGAQLTSRITINSRHALNIYGQACETGTIIATGTRIQSSLAGFSLLYAAAIGSDMYDTGTLTIYGGTINATGDYSAGIGGGGVGSSYGDGESYSCNGGNITIYGGNITATGDAIGAGIGGGWRGNGGTITIYGGTITATGGTTGCSGSGIGGGSHGNGGTINIYGGTVNARGAYAASGIGGGDDGNGGTITIHGGDINARGGEMGAGIGGGRNGNGGNVEINGGNIYADGGINAAGIGSGEEELLSDNIDGGKLTVYGGHVFADGTGWGAGIGGGEDADGAEVKIYGGIVEAYAGGDAGNKNGSAIGSEDGDNHRGTLYIDNPMMVHAGQTPTSISLFPSATRVPACFFRPYARIEPCNHEGATYTINGTGTNGTHTLQCTHCLSGGHEETHIFENYECTVCHVHGETCTISVYRPEYNSGTNTYSYGNTQWHHQLVKGSTFELPDGNNEHLPEGVRFVGWLIGSPSELGLTDPHVSANEALLTAGTSYTVNGDVSFTPRYKTFHVFKTAGNWNEASNWCWNEVPTPDKEIVIAKAATIPNGCIADVGNNLTLDLEGTLTIADGGQLFHSKEDLVATVQKNISAHNNNTNTGWNFIASPVAMSPATAGLITDDYENNIPEGQTATYDLYKFDQSTDLPWKNYRANNFNLSVGEGYLYANASNVTLEFSGNVMSTASNYSKELSYTEGTTMAGWNLVGNPFTCNATVSLPCYIIQDGVIVATNGTVAAPCSGVMVHTETTGQSVTFTPTTNSAAFSTGNSQIEMRVVQNVVSRGGMSSTSMDNAIVSFNEGSVLEKFYFGTQNANIYIPQDGKNYAIAFSEKTGELPLNFKAKEDGQYTLTINPENVEMAYLHLIDNLTGTDVDLLHPETLIASNDPQSLVPQYTFTAKTTDYESRFRLVFATEDGPSTGSGTFAFISNGNIIVKDGPSTGSGTLQVVDVMGRVIVSVGGHTRCVPTAGMAPGVYVLRLINGNDVKTQKIVMR
jgi:hypothetical protein